MKYTIKERQERTTRENKPFASVTLTDENGMEFPGVGVFDELDKFTIGATVEGEVSKNDKGYWNFRAANTKSAGGGSRSGMIKQAQAEKAAYIREAQQTKEMGIKIAGAQRDATLIVTTFYEELASMTPNAREENIKALWKEWRDWFINEFDKDTDSPFND